MPNEAEHIQQALHNMGVVDYLRARSNFCDWTATVTFYTALHVVEAVFFHTNRDRGKHGTKHEMREAMLKKDNRYKKLYQHYRPLLSASLVARYLRENNTGGVTFGKYMPARDVEEKLIKHHLRQIIKSAGNFLSSKFARLLKEAFDSTFA